MSSLVRPSSPSPCGSFTGSCTVGFVRRPFLGLSVCCWRPASSPFPSFIAWLLLKLPSSLNCVAPLQVVFKPLLRLSIKLHPHLSSLSLIIDPLVCLLAFRLSLSPLIICSLAFSVRQLFPISASSPCRFWFLIGSSFLILLGIMLTSLPAIFFSALLCFPSVYNLYYVLSSLMILLLLLSPLIRVCLCVTRACPCPYPLSA